MKRRRKSRIAIDTETRLGKADSVFFARSLFDGFNALVFDPLAPVLQPMCRCVAEPLAPVKRRHPCDGADLEPIEDEADLDDTLTYVFGVLRDRVPTLRERVEVLQLADHVEDAAHRLASERAWLVVSHAKRVCDAMRGRALRLA